MISDARSQRDKNLVSRLRAARAKRAAELEKEPWVFSEALACQDGRVKLQLSIGKTEVPDEETYLEWFLVNALSAGQLPGTAGLY